MSKREQISHGRWSEYLDQVSAGNRGRRVSLDVVGQAEGVPVPNAELSPVAVGLTDAPFLAIGYDPENTVTLYYLHFFRSAEIALNGKVSP